MLLLVALAACDGGSSAHVPSMAGHSFSTVEAEPGDLVKWFNDTDEAHTVTAVEESLPNGVPYFSSGGAPSEDAANENLTEELIGPGESFEWTFEEPGTYRYYCIPHRADGMTGTVVVE